MNVWEFFYLLEMSQWSTAKVNVGITTLKIVIFYTKPQEFSGILLFQPNWKREKNSHIYNLP